MGTPLNDYAKYQHPKQNVIFFFLSQNCTFYIFWGSKKLGPLKKKQFYFFSLCFRPYMNICTKFAGLCMKFQTKAGPPQATDDPHPLAFPLIVPQTTCKCIKFEKSTKSTHPIQKGGSISFFFENFKLPHVACAQGGCKNHL